jgi:hypothetical protein
MGEISSLDTVIFLPIFLRTSKCSLLDNGGNMLLTIAKDAAGTPDLHIFSGFVAWFALVTDHATANMGYLGIHRNLSSSSTHAIYCYFYDTTTC